MTTRPVRVFVVTDQLGHRTVLAVLAHESLNGIQYVQANQHGNTARKQNLLADSPEKQCIIQRANVLRYIGMGSPHDGTTAARTAVVPQRSRTCLKAIRQILCQR